MSTQDVGVSTSEVWSILANESITDLLLTRHDDGAVSGSLAGDPLTGFWDAPSGTLTLMRAPKDPGDPHWFGEGHQLLTGRQFTLGSGSGAAQVLSGWFEAGRGTGATAAAHRFGWFAIKRGEQLPGAPLPGTSPADHILSTVSTLLPGLDATSPESLVIVGNGAVGPMNLHGAPAQPPGSFVWAEMFGAGEPNAKGFIRRDDAAPGFPPEEVALFRMPGYSSGDADAFQVYRGHSVRGFADAGHGTRKVLSGWAGEFTALAGTGATPGRTVYGWFALSMQTTPV